MDSTTILIKKTTRDKLKKLRLVNRESYDSVINRISTKEIREALRKE